MHLKGDSELLGKTLWSGSTHQENNIKREIQGPKRLPKEIGSI